MTDAKRVLRDTLRHTRSTLPPTYRAEASARVNAHLAALTAVAESRNLGAYAATGTELNIDPLLTGRLSTGRPVYLPRVVGGHVEFATCTSTDDLSPGFAGIREPTAEAIEVGQLDAVLVPGVGFDRHGNRLGNGAGHYDQILTQLSSTCITVGVAFHHQLVASLPVGPHDIPVRFIVTEEGVIDTTSRR